MRVSRATSGAGDWTPVLSAGELGAVAVHLVELGRVAGILLERGLGAAAWRGRTGRGRRRALATGHQWSRPGELAAIAAHLVELGHVAALNAGELAIALAYLAREQIAGPRRRGAPRRVRTFRRTGGGGL
ncbi:hypothetical protein WME90_12200 [Sorangium sp. So ce375]|uniref:hypothetical protein n=1 Tax=Sorangium sp. So ce375 TaxID=3133306 RepID=UPI003F5C205A